MSKNKYILAPFVPKRCAGVAVRANFRAQTSQFQGHLIRGLRASGGQAKNRHGHHGNKQWVSIGNLKPRPHKPPREGAWAPPGDAGTGLFGKQSGTWEPGAQGGVLALSVRGQELFVRPNLSVYWRLLARARVA